MKKFRWSMIMTSAALSVLLCRFAHADEMNLGDLYRMCTSADAGDKTACRFYILGVFEAAELVGASVEGADGKMEEAKEKRFCVPDGMSGAAMELLVKKSMGEDLAVYPDDHKLPAVSFVSSVVRVNFPCKNRK